MVQVIPKEFIKSKPTIISILPWLSMFLLVIVVVTYFVLGHQINNSKVALDKVKQDLAKLQTEEQKTKETRIITLKTKIDDAVRLLQEHQKPTNFIVFLEAFIHPGVTFNSLTLNLEAKRAILGGTANDFKSLGQQIYVFEQQPFIQTAKLSNISLLEGKGIKFNLDLLLASKDSKNLK